MTKRQNIFHTSSAASAPRVLLNYLDGQNAGSLPSASLAWSNLPDATQVAVTKLAEIQNHRAEFAAYSEHDRKQILATIRKLKVHAIHLEPMAWMGL